MSAELIYKTTSPAALAWWERIAAESEKARLRRADFIAKVTEQFGPTPSVGRYTEAPTERQLMISRHNVAGLASGYSERPPEDSGWRLDSKDRYWAPKLATKAGKDRAAELKKLAAPNARQSAPEIGVPQLAMAGAHLYSPGFEFDEETGTLYQLWGSGRCVKECESAQAKTPEIAWTEVLRSEWFAREEAKAAEA